MGDRTRAGNHVAKIEYLEYLGSGLYRMGLSAKGISKGASPGQFYMIRVHKGLHPLLRRPFAISRRYLSKARHVPHGDGMEILFQVVGIGTQMLSEKSEGDLLEALGPLGRGWRLDPVRSPVLVGGGIGVASLLSLAEELPQEIREKAIAILGARERDQLVALEDFQRAGLRTLWIVEEASRGGRAGTVMDLLRELEGDLSSMDAHVYTCGPPAMIRAVAGWSKEREIPCQVSLETVMACGMGLCLGCAVRTSGGHGYKKACIDGPVFDAADLEWGNING